MLPYSICINTLRITYMPLNVIYFIIIFSYDIDGALLVYDITDAESFNKVKAWVKELRKILGNEIAVAIAGNKIDLEKNRNVNEAEAKA